MNAHHLLSTAYISPKRRCLAPEKIDGWNMKLPFKWSIFKGHVNVRGVGSLWGRNSSFHPYVHPSCLNVGLSKMWKASIVVIQMFRSFLVCLGCELFPFQKNTSALLHVYILFFWDEQSGCATGTSSPGSFVSFHCPLRLFHHCEIVRNHGFTHPLTPNLESCATPIS